MSHSIFAPSSCHRWIRCPGSIAAESGFEDKATIYSAEGTLAHQVAAECYVNTWSPLQYVMKVFEIDGFHIEFTHDMAEHVQTYLDYLFALNCKLGLVENKIDLGHIIPDTSGTSDYVGVDIDSKTLHVVDLKFGKGKMVYAENNEQMQLYALGALKMVEYLDIDFDKVVLHIVQPRIDHIDTWETCPEALAEFAGEAYVAYEYAGNKYPPIIPGPIQCQWCRAKATCKEAADYVEDAVRNQFPILDHKDLPDEQLAHALSLVNMVTDWAKAIEAHATEQLSLGFSVPGYKLVAGRSNRKWGDESEAESALRKAARRLKIKVSDLYVQTFKSAPALEKELGKKVFAQFADLVVKPEGRPVIAPESDKRPAINPAEAAGFPNLDQEQ